MKNKPPNPQRGNNSKKISFSIKLKIFKIYYLLPFVPPWGLGGLFIKYP